MAAYGRALPRTGPSGIGPASAPRNYFPAAIVHVHATGHSGVENGLAGFGQLVRESCLYLVRTYGRVASHLSRSLR
jgi:hypothetical protein